MEVKRTYKIRDILIQWPPSVSFGSFGPGDTLGFDVLSSVIMAASFGNQCIVLDVMDKERRITTALRLRDPRMEVAIKKALLAARGRTLEQFGSMEIRF